MTESQRKLLEAVGGTEADTVPSNAIEERVAALEQQLTELRSFVNSIGKTELQGNGSAEQPFEWAVGIELIPNAYYTYNGKRFVWMGVHGIATADNPPLDIGGDWAEF